jgi:E3 ubiquitin-protein ligase HECTD2
VLEVRRADGSRVVKPGKDVAGSGSGAGAVTPPLTVEKAREVIEKCVVEYLLGRLRHDDDDDGSKKGTTATGDDSMTSGLQKDQLGRSAGVASMVLDTNEVRPEKKAGGSDAQEPTAASKDGPPPPAKSEASRGIFAALEDYITTSFGTLECINNSFSTSPSSITVRTASEGTSKHTPPLKAEKYRPTAEALSELDAKTLLLGDVAENGLWWTGGRTGGSSPERSRGVRADSSNEVAVTLKSPRIDWADVHEWYYLVVNAGISWRQKLDELIASEPEQKRFSPLFDQELDDIGTQIIEAQSRAQRVLLKATESLLKRPGRPLQDPSDLRFLLIILANPLLYPAHIKMRGNSRSRSRERKISKELNPNTSKDSKLSPIPAGTPSANAGRGSSGRHSGIIKRILGLLSNVPNECHHHLVSWFARYPDGQFQRTTDLIGSFVTYRLTRQNGQKRDVDQDPTAGLIPSMSSSGRNTSAALHAALGSSGQSSKKSDGKPQTVIYNDDWQIKAAARVMALFFSANNSGLSRRGNTRGLVTPENGQSAGLAARERAHNHGQILPTSDFYNTLLDYSDLIVDFEAWESRRGKFTFCQYPFFLSIWAKIQIMEHDARRQMEVKAREAFFDSIMTHKTVNQYLVLKIRRDCLVEDSLKGVSEVVGSGDEEIKKGLRIEFKGEEGIDAGGLRKEWFLLLVRDVFNPEHGMFNARMMVDDF